MVADYRLALDERRGDRIFSALLSALTTYAKAHFRHEEEALAGSTHPLAARNAAEHREFEQRLEEWRRRFEADGFREDDARRLMDMLEAWLDAHISGVDARLGEALRQG